MATRRRDWAIVRFATDGGTNPVQANIDEGVRAGTQSDEVDELRRLRRDDRRLQQGAEIMRRATAYLAKDAAPK